MVKKILHVDGMTCISCETRIQEGLKKRSGLVDVKASYPKSQVMVTFDDEKLTMKQIVKTIESLDYGVGDPAKPTKKDLSIHQWVGIGILLFAIYILIQNTIGFNFIPEVDPSMGYGLLFLVGLLTSLHCIAMCGGINLSQCLYFQGDNGSSYLRSTLKPSLLYNAGRVLSYTLIGGVVGALGSVINLSVGVKGGVALISGVLMVIMGLNMLQLFPWLRKLQPRLPKVFGEKLNHAKGSAGPFYVGLLNGLMPCGPLQAMQIYALGTGSFAAGALSMFLFSLGTVPLMFGFGALGSLIRGKFSRRMMKVSAVLVIVLGLAMVNRGLALPGLVVPTVQGGVNGGVPGATVASVQSSVQTVTTQLSPNRYEPIVVEKGIPVTWTIQAQAGDINGCNNEIILPAFNEQLALSPGNNVLVFTPTETGTFGYSCWMGMIRSSITVVDDIDEVKAYDFNDQNPTFLTKK